MRIISLNLNHRTLPKPVPPSVLDSLETYEPDILTFNEFVAGPANEGLKAELASVGLPHCVISQSVAYSPGRTQNQILVASREPIRDVYHYSGAPEAGGNTNTLTVTIGGLRITSMRAPAYQLIRDWRDYWNWLGKVVQGQVIVGDLNVDPLRGNSRDRVFADAFEDLDWRHYDPKGDWSYKGTNGSTARLDHVLTRHGFICSRCEYLRDPFVPTFTDHAALLADIKKVVDKGVSNCD